MEASDSWAPRQSRSYPDRPLVGVGVIVFRDKEVLLIRRAKPPYGGEWSIPGGAQRLGETTKQAARRELLEETGILVGELTLALVADLMSHDAHGMLQYHYTVIDYVAEWTSGEAAAADDAEEARWFPMDQLDQLALRPSVIEALSLASTQRQK
ncbi:NUDIX hydrolase [Pseudoroseomonas globiformis]|uniref:NUDIX hydrolase n=1 Tax=Teichococcus globiformis TaxID=2307229 RepID=A0ABV7FZH3_9PROT